MSIQFNDAAADALVSVATRVHDLLVGQSFSRQNAAGLASLDFHGAYANLFKRAVEVESQDRRRLAEQCEVLAAQVLRVKDAARREREAAFLAWQVRDEQRRRDAHAAHAGGRGQYPVLDAWSDPMPPMLGVVPEPIEVSFSAQGRQRSTGGRDSSGRSGAVPERLRGF